MTTCRARIVAALCYEYLYWRRLCVCHSTSNLYNAEYHQNFLKIAIGIAPGETVMKPARPRVPVQAASPDPNKPATNSQKVSSSRYEWEQDVRAAQAYQPPHNRRSATANYGPAGAFSAYCRSLAARLKSWFARWFSSDTNFFDNDDDASPSAA